MSDDYCNCKIPYRVYNGVCGLCLMPLKGTVAAEGGKLIEDRSEDFYDEIDHDEEDLDDPDFNDGP